MSKRTKIIFIGAILVVIILGIAIGNMEYQKEEATDTMKVGFIISGAADDEGWNGMHYKGVKEACEELGVELIVKENVAELKGECVKAVKELAEEKASVIILSSYNTICNNLTRFS